LNRNLLIHLLGRPGEVEATRNNRLLVDDHDLVVSDPVSGVNVSGTQLLARKEALVYFAVLVQATRSLLLHSRYCPVTQTTAP
jgi:hypothetical protein